MRNVMQALDWKDVLGILSVSMAIVAAVIYIVQTLRGEVRPHPLSWFLFGILSATGYWVQRDQGAHQGSWTLLAMTIICFLFVAAIPNAGVVEAWRLTPVRISHWYGGAKARCGNGRPCPLVV
jgi:hypothetical protein